MLRAVARASRGAYPRVSRRAFSAKKAGNGAACRSSPSSASSDGEGAEGRRMSIQEIQKLHAEKIMGGGAGNVRTAKDPVRGRNAIRGSDGFLEFEEVEAPWKHREGPYKIGYLVDDGNYLLRKSKTAHNVLGAFSVAFAGGTILVYWIDPTLLL